MSVCFFCHHEAWQSYRWEVMSWGAMFPGCWLQLGPAAWYAADGNDHWFTWFFLPSPLDEMDSKWKWRIRNYFFRGRFFGVLRGVVPGVPSLKRTACHVEIGIGKFIGKFPKPFLLAWAKPGRWGLLALGVCIHLPSGKLTISRRKSTTLMIFIRKHGGVFIPLC